ncbi:MAG TPA: alanine--tRNA ligase [Kofleriaceae bacterium]|nr:alanine--tRNA ligase [Kofleriaceae bacterium]
MITSSELRHRYLSFFTTRGHVAMPSASLVPTNDSSVLFTTAGMHPLVPYLLGAPHPSGRRLTNVQKCVRTGDIDEIGDDTHLTFFEMLGNWSLGDYTRDDAIRWSFEFLTTPEGLELPIDRLGVTCFAGDDEVARDHESILAWRSLGIPHERIQLLGRDDNWWGPAGETGPCGPDTEIFYWLGELPPPVELDVRDRRWVEIWNNVFMGYTKTALGTIEPLDRINVDTGMGLERTVMAINGLTSVYEVDTVAPLVRALRDFVPDGCDREIRIIVDHVRAACFVIGDGVAPSNKDRGYIVRRLLRRSLVFAKRMGLPREWYRSVITALVETLGDVYPELGRDPTSLVRTIEDEIRRFDRTLEQGLNRLRRASHVDGKTAFDLLQTYGFPFELTLEIAEAAGHHIDRASFATERDRHRERSRSAGSFAGGLADHSVEIVRYHTLTHLLQAALREVLGLHVIQRGSNITRERLRFDFSHDGAPSDAQLSRVEELVNGWLARPLVVDRATMTEPEARALGAIGAFGERYGETVSIYTIADTATGDIISREFCAGPHVRSVRDDITGRFRIVREHGIATGVRRIKAVVDPS